MQSFWKSVQIKDDDMILPALEAGGVGATSFALFGALKNLIKVGHPVAAGVVYGSAGFLLGAPFWSTRQTLLRSWQSEREITPKDKILASGIGGLVGGAFTAILPYVRPIKSAIMWGAILAAGQTTVNVVGNYRMSRSLQRPVNTPDVGKKSWLDSKWSPVQVLTDDDYEKILQRKVLHVTAQIELIDEQIDALRSCSYEQSEPERAEGEKRDKQE